MIRTLTVFYLHRPHRLDGKNLPIVEYGLADAVHGLFCRGGHAPYFVEVLNRDEESRVVRLNPSD